MQVCSCTWLNVGGPEWWAWSMEHNHGPPPNSISCRDQNPSEKSSMAGSTGSATNEDYLYVSSKKITVKTQNTKFMAFPWSHMWSPVCCLNTCCWFASDSCGITIRFSIYFPFQLVKSHSCGSNLSCYSLNPPFQTHIKKIPTKMSHPTINLHLVILFAEIFPMSLSSPLKPPRARGLWPPPAWASADRWADDWDLRVSARSRDGPCPQRPQRGVGKVSKGWVEGCNL